MKLTVSTNSYNRVRISTAHLASIDDNDAVTMIVEVFEPGYVPERVMVRARISDHLFTGITEARNLTDLEHDPKIKSAMVGKR
jgi:hypothetical protein